MTRIAIAASFTLLAVASTGAAHAQGCIDLPSELQGKCYDDWAARDRAEQLKRIR